MPIIGPGMRCLPSLPLPQTLPLGFSHLKGSGILENLGTIGRAATDGAVLNTLGLLFQRQSGELGDYYCCMRSYGESFLVVLLFIMLEFLRVIQVLVPRLQPRNLAGLSFVRLFATGISLCSSSFTYYNGRRSSVG